MPVSQVFTFRRAMLLLLEQRTQPEGELAAAAVNRVARFTARKNILAHRCHRWLSEKAIVMKQRQQVTLDLLRIHHAAVGDRCSATWASSLRRNVTCKLAAIPHARARPRRR